MIQIICLLILLAVVIIQTIRLLRSDKLRERQCVECLSKLNDVRAAEMKPSYKRIYLVLRSS